MNCACAPGSESRNLAHIFSCIYADFCGGGEVARIRRLAIGEVQCGRHILALTTFMGWIEWRDFGPTAMQGQRESGLTEIGEGTCQCRDIRFDVALSLTRLLTVGEY